MRTGRRLFIAGVVLLVAAVAVAQGRRFRGFGEERPNAAFIQPNPPYDGRFVFLRVNYETAPGGFWYGGLPAWSHGYPLAEQNLMRILNEVTYIDPHLDGIATVGFDSPELFKYPMAYIIEVGWWVLSDGEATALRAYLQKGGFVLVDDFKVRGWGGGMGGGGWEQFEANMKRVMPEGRFLDLDVSPPDLSLVLRDRIVRHHSAGLQLRPPDLPRALRGQRSDQADADDGELQHRRVAVLGVVSARLPPVDETNEAYKLGVNYIMYGLTH